MATETTKQENSKKMIKIGALVVILGALIWQLWGIFKPSVSVVPATARVATKPQTMSNSSPTSSSSGSAPAAAQTVTQTQTVTQSSSVPTDLQQLPVPTDPELLRRQQESEQNYVMKVNELEDLKLQRQIAETNQAIAAAKLATVTSEKVISDMLTKPTPPPVSADTYANQLSNNNGNNADQKNEPAKAHAVQGPVAISYTVVSVSMQQNKWSAVIGSQGVLYNVGVGDVLPPDGSTILSINKNGVLLSKNGSHKKLSILSSF